MEIITINDILEHADSLSHKELVYHLKQIVENEPRLGHFNHYTQAVTKIWSHEDVTGKIEDMGYIMPCQDTIEAIFSDAVDGLSDCNDTEWCCIENAIQMHIDDDEMLGVNEED